MSISRRSSIATFSEPAAGSGSAAAIVATAVKPIARSSPRLRAMLRVCENNIQRYAMILPLRRNHSA